MSEPAWGERTPPGPVEDVYLGDGVYASFDGFQFWLDLRAQGPDKIALDPDVCEAFDLYRAKVKRQLEGLEGR